MPDADVGFESGDVAVYLVAQFTAEQLSAA
jgi:hypothetical protein